MSKVKFFQIHQETPQVRLINQVVDVLKGNGVIAYPTDSGYALGCMLDNKEGVDRMRLLRQLDKHHNFALVCGNLNKVGVYAKFDNSDYRLLKQYTPGPFTFVMKATTEVPRRVMHPKRREIGIRVPDNAIAQALCDTLDEPIISTTLIPPGEAGALFDPWEINDRFGHGVDLIIDGGWVAEEPTTVVSLLDKAPELIRQGAGVIAL